MAIRTRNGKLVKSSSGKAVASTPKSVSARTKVRPSSKAVGPTDPNAGKSKAVTKFKRQIKDVKGTDRTVEPKKLKDGSKIGPAGERHGSSKVSTGYKGVAKSILKLGKSALNPLLIALQSQELGGGKDMIDPKNPPKLYSGFKKKEAPAKKKAPTKKKKEASTKKASTTSSSFGAEFKKAKKAGKSKFSWNGKSYSTATKDDVKKSNSKDLRQHLNKAEGKTPTTFGDAFKAAKKAGKSTFNFKGKVYSTKTK